MGQAVEGGICSLRKTVRERAEKPLRARTFLQYREGNRGRCLRNFGVVELARTVKIEVQGTARLSPARGVEGQEEKSTSLRLE